MTGFKNMKKIVAVLVLALVAMTAVFAAKDAAVASAGADTVKVTLNIEGYTKFAFTAEELITTDISGATLAGDEDMSTHQGSDNAYGFWASVVSTNKGGASVKITIPSALETKSGNDIVGSIPLKYTFDGSEKTSEIIVGVDGAKDSRATIYSKQIKVYIPDNVVLSEQVSGDYSADIVMAVTAL